MERNIARKSPGEKETFVRRNKERFVKRKLPVSLDKNPRLWYDNHKDRLVNQLVELIHHKPQ